MITRTCGAPGGGVGDAVGLAVGLAVGEAVGEAVGVGVEAVNVPVQWPGSGVTGLPSHTRQRALLIGTEPVLVCTAPTVTAAPAAAMRIPAPASLAFMPASFISPRSRSPRRAEGPRESRRWCPH